MNPYNKKFFTAILNDMSFNFCDVILPKLREQHHIDSIVDVGCGNGGFILCAKEKHGVKKILGIDGAYATEHFRCGPTEFLPMNLEKPTNVDDTFDLVVSLEVAEHLDEKAADSFVDLLTSLGQVVLFSAAGLGQTGVHHVNCQAPEYWQNKFKDRGYECNDIIRPFIGGMENINRWYRKNGYLYVK